MIAYATLSGVPITIASFAIPLFGLWAGDVELATDQPIPVDGSLTVGNLTMACHVYRQAGFTGTRRARLVAGRGGWRVALRAKQYALSQGVTLSLVLGDAAREVGERVNVQTDSVIGSSYVRENAPASRVLRQLAGPDWYVDPAGVTQIGPWPTRPVRSAFTVEDQNGAEGRVRIATEDNASWLPGATFTAPTLDGTFTVRGVEYRISNEGKLRLEVLT